jgi:hypothetical protein
LTLARIRATIHSMHTDWEIEIGNAAQVTATVRYNGTELGATRRVNRVARETAAGQYVCIYRVTPQGRASFPFAALKGLAQ